MKLTLLRTCIFCIIGLSGTSLASQKVINVEDYVDSVYLATSKTWPLLEKVWDTPVYRKLRIVIADDHNAWAIDSKSLLKIPYSEIVHRHLPVEFMHYQDIEWSDGRPTLYISMGASLPLDEIKRFQTEQNPVPLLFNIATHEAFHCYVQQGKWRKEMVDKDSRATPYPIESAPRFYRNSIIRSLYSALQDNPKGLGQARYWFDQWKKQYPDEAERIRQIDVKEGSARYIETAAEIIAKGKEFNTSEFRLALHQKFRDEENIISTTADTESYLIGAMAGFILDRKKTPWQALVTQGTPPLDILIRDVKPIIQQADSNLKHAVEREITKENKTSAAAIESFSQAWHYPAAIKFFISFERSGSYSVGNHFRTKTIPYNLMTDFSSSAVWPGGSYSIKQGVAALVENDADFRNKNGFFILYTDKLPAPKGGRLIINTEKLKLNIPYPENINQSGTIYLS